MIITWPKMAPFLGWLKKHAATCPKCRFERDAVFPDVHGSATINCRKARAMLKKLEKEQL